MAENEFTISSDAVRLIREQGYEPRRTMDGKIAEWRALYTGTDPFFEVPYVNASGARRKRRRNSLKPARRVCRELASLILTDDTEVSVEKPLANEWLGGLLARSNFWPTGQRVVESCAALGTAAWALSFDVRDDEVRRILMPRYDARMVLPLTFDSQGVYECAFVTRVTDAGKDAEQVQLMTMDDGTGTYHVRTWLLRDGKPLDPESCGIIADFDTRSRFKPFGIFTTGNENVHDDLSPFGASIFADAEDEIKAVDIAWDAFIQEITLTGVRLFVDDELISTGEDGGRVVPTGVAEDMFYRKVEGKEAKNYIETFSPNIRTEPLLAALNASLAEMGDACGFGQNYFTLDKPGGMKTAKEVMADSSQLMRTVRKHENALRGGIQDVVGALLDNHRIHLGAEIEEDFGAVSVMFDDSVITDTQSEKETMMAEIAAGVVPKWMYLVEFYGKSEDEARALLPEATFDPGY